MSRKSVKPHNTAGWDPIALWYDGWMGAEGSRFHREVAIPLTMELAAPRRGHRVLDVGCGQGVLAEKIAGRGAHYTGIDVSSTLVRKAIARHGTTAGSRFLHCDAGMRSRYAKHGPFDLAILLLSVQDMPAIDRVFSSVGSALRPRGRIVIVMTHPCFRIPRMSGWGVDPGRKLVYRRVDGYLTSRKIPIRLHGRNVAKTFSYHRPLSEYTRELARAGFSIDALEERTVTAEQQRKIAIRGPSRHNEDIPVLLGIVASRGGQGR